MNKPGEDDTIELRFHYWFPREHLFIREPDNLKPRAFHRKSTNQVLITLARHIMASPIDLYDYTPLREEEIYYSVETKEWVLGPVRLSQEAYIRLEPDLRHSWVAIEARPVTEKHASQPEEWGPESP